MTHRLGLETPLGPLTLEEEGGAITSVSWERCDDPQPSAVLERAVDQLRAYFAKSRRAFDLPLAPGGSDFEQAVWRAMLAIPYGQTRSYGDLARALDAPPRAVGTACGRNPIPIVIPCHRVVGAGGALTGYTGGGGIETKSFLLSHEGALLV